MKENKQTVNKKLKKIPSVDDVVKQLNLLEYNFPHKFLINKIRIIIDHTREKIISGHIIDDVKKYIFEISSKVIEDLEKSNLRAVINGTGIILHTGLGRAPISKEILKKSFYQIYPNCNIELDVTSGERGERNQIVNDLINSITDSEASIVVNNNAAAVILMLNTLAEHKEILISRGQQVEIGGSFRIPEIVNKSGCKMIEVGTTNRTYIKDYEDAINDSTGAILVAHTSNYKVIGFTHDVELSELAQLANERGIPLLLDLGSSSVADFSEKTMPIEPHVSTYLKSGANVISFSGDKLLGAVQAGIICGDQRLVKKIHENPLYRALRCDKVTFSIIENILRTYIKSNVVSDQNLTYKLFTRDINVLREIGNKILSEIDTDIIELYGISLINTFVEAGSGSLPTEKIPSIAIIFKSSIKAKKIATDFRQASIPIIGYIYKNKFIIDLKAIPDDMIDSVILIFKEVLI